MSKSQGLPVLINWGALPWTHIAAAHRTPSTEFRVFSRSALLHFSQLLLPAFAAIQLYVTEEREAQRAHDWPPLRQASKSELPKMADLALVEETVKRLSSHKGVRGVLIVNAEGVPLRSTVEHELAVQYAALATQLAAKARSVVRELAREPNDDLHSLRVRSKKHGTGGAGRGGVRRGGSDC